MKKILFVSLLIGLMGTANAVNVQLTKVVANVTTTYSGITKDSVLNNNAGITTNIFPISYLTLHIKMQGLSVVGPSSNSKVGCNVHNGYGVKIITQSHIITTNDDDATISIISPALLPLNIVGRNFDYEVRITFIQSPTIQTLLATSNKWSCQIINDPDKIYNNVICCSEPLNILPYTPTKPLDKDPNTGVTATATNLQIKYVWEKGITSSSFRTIPGASNASYFPPRQVRDTYYRRVAISYRAGKEVSYHISNTVSIARKPCTRPSSTEDAICNDQGFYNLKNGDSIYPSKIIGSYLPWPSIASREQGYQYLMSYDGITWPYSWPLGIERIYGSAAKPDDFTIPAPIIFNINNGAVQYIYIKREYYEFYDDWNCGLPPLLPKFPCGVKFHLKSTSNIVTLVLTSANPPKPVVDTITNESGYDKASCSYSDQTRTFSVPQINNGETYKWEIPAGWIAYTALEGPYVNSITISTNSGGANYAKGGNVCLTIKQPGQINSMCRYIEGSEPFSVNLPPVLSGCEGSEIIVKPVVLKNNVVMPNSEYSFGWEAYQSPTTECIPQSTKYDDGCRELKITIGNVYQNPIQPIKVTAINNFACIATATRNLTTVPGLQMGILNSFADPKASSTSNTALNERSNHLYFTATNNVIQRAYFDDNVGSNIWRYAELKYKINNTPIICTGSVSFYEDLISQKLFYVNLGSLYYAESIDNGSTWTNNNSIAFAPNVSARIKISGNNVYYIDATSNKIFSKSIINAAPALLVGNATINYSQDMFAVEDGILSYADQNNNIVAFDAITGNVLPINIAANLKAVAYNSAIHIYNNNIYYVSTMNTMRILQKSATSSSYTASQDVSSQLAGPFAINKQTGTIYSKAYDVPGKQIYYLNNQWTITPIKNYMQGSPIQSSMIYGNGHAYYIGTNGLISNTFYIAPCIPNVLRIGGGSAFTDGDLLNDPFPATINAINTLTVYPNPSHDKIHVSFSIEKESLVQIKIIALSGITEIVSSSTLEQGVHDIEMSISKYVAGAYIIQLYVNDDLINSSKLIKY